MPKGRAMMQLSRPFQIVLVTFCLFAAVWFFALRGHSASTSGGGSSPPSAASPAAQPATPSTPYHGSAPGVAGLTRAIEKAQGAVTQSEQHAKRLQQKSAQASGEASGGTAPNTSKAGAGAAHAVTPKARPRRRDRAQGRRDRAQERHDGAEERCERNRGPRRRQVEGQRHPGHAGDRRRRPQAGQAGDRSVLESQGNRGSSRPQ